MAEEAAARLAGVRCLAGSASGIDSSAMARDMVRGGEGLPRLRRPLTMVVQAEFAALRKQLVLLQATEDTLRSFMSPAPFEVLQDVTNTGTGHPSRSLRMGHR